MSQPHSTLEVDHRANAPEVFPYYAPEAVKSGHDTNKIAYHDADKYYHDASPQSRTICGLRKRSFWIVLVIAIIVVAAAVGGGVGGALSSRSSKSSSSSDSDGSSSSHNAQSSATATRQSPDVPQSSSVQSISTATVSTQTLTNPTSSATILRDCPSSNTTIFTVTGQMFRKTCSNSMQPNPSSNSVNKPTVSLDECIALCAAYNVANRTQIQTNKSKPCNTVCWRNTYDKINDQPGGQCFGFETRNITVDAGVGSGTTWRMKDPPETRCDSAGLINQDF